MQVIDDSHLKTFWPNITLNAEIKRFKGNALFYVLNECVWNVREYT